jgi:putative endonuclease
MNKKELGDWGEEQACSFLVQQDYEILERNFRLSKNEIDIIARDKEGVLSFVEVKTREYNDGSAERADDLKKQAIIKKVAIHYCLTHEIDIDRTPMKLEHISVYYNNGRDNVEIRKFVLLT